MKRILTSLAAAVVISYTSFAQITCTNAIFADTTHYTNGSPNDSLYFICTGQTAQLIASPPSGTPGWNFQWENFIPSANTWNPLVIETGVSVSTQNVSSGGYRVKIFDGTSTLVGTYIAWVCKVNSTPTVNVNTIPEGCGSVLLSALVINGAITPYYNPPSNDAPPTLIIDADTEISICFSATHTWVSDLAFYVVGPASCGSPTLLLSPNPGANGQGTVCNSGNNVVNLCFSNSSTNNLDVCAGAPFTLQGTFGTYGPTATPIDWSLLYGCDAANAGWAVQIYDCILGDAGSLTDATLTFNGVNSLGDPMTVTYTTPTNYNSPINDGTCSSASASIFQVAGANVSAIPIQHSFGYQWSANPPYPIPNSSNSLNIILDPAPQVDTYFTLELVGSNPGAACGGTDTDTELFHYVNPSVAIIEAVSPTYCELDSAFNLTVDQTSGTWSGSGITNGASGTFDPAVAGEGIFTVTYTPTSSCIAPASVEINVIGQPTAVITPVSTLCSSSDPIDLTANYTGGTWSGDGITNSVIGTFDPSQVGGGTTSVLYQLDGNCPITGTILIDVVAQADVIISAPQEVCITESPFILTANISGGVWSGDGITDSVNGNFDPSAVGSTQAQIGYSYSGVCSGQGSFTIAIADSTLNITEVPVLCLNSNPIDLQASVTNGEWSGIGITNSGLGIFSPTTLADPGQYTVSFIADNACNAEASIVIEVIGTPQVNITTLVNAICEDMPVMDLEANISGGIWSGDGIIDTSTGLFDASQAGLGPANISYTISGICPTSDNLIIQVNPLPNMNAGADVAICYGATTTLNGSGSTTINWSPANTLSSFLIDNPVANPLSTTTYTLTGLTAFGCTASDEVTVTVYPEINLEVNGPFTICAGDEVLLQASGLTTYYWTGQNLLDGSTSNPTGMPFETSTYNVSGEDTNGCPASADIAVNVIVPQAEFTASTLEGIAPLTVNFTNTSVGDSFSWDFGNGVNFTTDDVNFSPSQTFTFGGTYNVELTTTLDGCTGTTSIDIFVFMNSALVLVPNIVTMGGDNRNDNFKIESINMKSLDIQIFDRWGKLVGSIDKPTGQWSPIEVGSGTYYYYLKAEGYDAVEYDRAGYFTVFEE
jgi:gliding motility-associated-like protein